MQKISEFEETATQMALHGYNFPQKVFLKLENPKTVLFNALKYFVGESAKWLPEYDKVAAWMSDNEGKGLFMFGANGRGKTILGQRVIPAILLKYFRRVTKVCDAQTMNNELDDILKKKIISLDDVGTEDLRVVYGEKRWAFPEIIDIAEKRGNLVLATTNLGVDELSTKYGVRTLERITATCKRVTFNGKSLRK